MPAVTKKSVPAGRRSRQRGAALMVFSIIFVLAALAYLLSSLGPELGEARRERQTHDALAQARDALIGYALKYREDQMADGQPDRVYGYLPLPDLGTSRNNNASCANEGCAAANFGGNGLNTTVIGRLPWRTLGLEPLRDGNAECLWYIVSGSHQNQQRVTPMNWDVLGHLDVVVANGGAALAAALTSAHERPVAVIFSPGPPLPGQDRSLSATDSVTNCGGNYEAKNYFDPVNAAAMDGVTNYLGGANSASSVTDSDTSRKPLALQGKVFALGGNFLPNACEGNCSLLANDAGLALTGDQLFGAIRKHANFRTDINSLMDRITDCLRDSGVAGGYGKIGGLDDGTLCYGSQVVPRGYFQHYREMTFTAGGTMQVNGTSNCAGALLFANQRGPGQLRITGTDKNNPANFLEGINHSSFVTPGTAFSGHEILERISPIQSISQDIVRCIPSTPSFVTTQSAVAGVPQMASYTPGSRTITLGHGVETALASSLSNYLYGCAWRPETHAMGGGLRSYFTFRINDELGPATWPTLGFTFAIVDGDNNGTTACGAAGQHLGYSGNNTESPFIAPPKIAFEVDPRREGALFPSSGTLPSKSHLTNGRNDPPTDSANYRGGHVALVYWGGETPIGAPAIDPCDPPAYLSGGVCTLPQEEDDNVHGQAAPARSGFPAPPPNPAAPIPRLNVPPDSPAGVYKLDPNTASVPTNDPPFHVRVELTRMPATYNLPRVRVATTEEINLSTPGTIDAYGNHLFQVDGVYLFADDRVLVKDQSDLKLNGIYAWKGADKPMERAEDAKSVEALAGLIVEVMQGKTQARQLWRQQTVQPAVCAKPIECTSFVWQPVNVSGLPGNQAGRVVYVQKGSQANGWFRSNGAAWQPVSADLSAQEAINLSSAPPTIDGIAPTAGSRILVRHQSNAAENGVYIWGGPGADIRTGWDGNFDSATKLAGAVVQVLSGSDAGRAFRQTAMPYGGTIGTDAVRWEAIDASPRYKLEAWILRDSPSYTQLIAAMQNTTRPMSFLTAIMSPPPNFPPQLRDTPVIPYPFRNVRLGFTIGQRTSINDQTVTIGNYFTTWLP